jgi:hypothetical protein
MPMTALKTITFSLFLAAMVFLLLPTFPPSWSTTDDVLPDATHIGANTFGCLINGKAWFADSVHAVVYEADGNMMISLWVQDEQLVFRVPASGAIGTHGELNTASRYASFRQADACTFNTDNYYTGRLTITHHDRVNSTLSGDFYFLASSPECDDEVQFESGRFDVTYLRH